MSASSSLMLASAPIIFSAEGIVGRRLAVSPKIEIVHLAIDPRKSLPLHTMPTPVIFFVIEGCGTLRTNKSAESYEAGTTVEVPAGVERGWANESLQPLAVLVIKPKG